MQIRRLVSINLLCFQFLFPNFELMKRENIE